uniref:DUF4149 domain-containing protein n=1 Tax=Steinernema glaseri TaxID=37863 RepID=A0A1I7Z5P0_9BILA
MHVKTGLLLIGSIMLVSGFSGILNNVLDGSLGVLATIVSILVNVVTLAVGGVTVYAVKKEQHKMLLPFIVCQYITLGFLALLAMGTLVLQFFPTWVANATDMAKGDKPEDYATSAHIALGIMTAMIAISALFPLWYLNIAKKAYKVIEGSNASPSVPEANAQKA